MELLRNATARIRLAQPKWHDITSARFYELCATCDLFLVRKGGTQRALSRMKGSTTRLSGIRLEAAGNNGTPSWEVLRLRRVFDYREKRTAKEDAPNMCRQAGTRNEADAPKCTRLRKWHWRCLRQRVNPVSGGLPMPPMPADPYPDKTLPGEAPPGPIQAGAPLAASW